MMIESIHACVHSVPTPSLTCCDLQLGNGGGEGGANIACGMRSLTCCPAITLSFCPVVPGESCHQAAALTAEAQMDANARS